MKMSLSKKLYGLTGVLLAILVVMATVAFFSSRTVVKGYQDLALHESAQREAAMNCLNELGLSLLSYKNYVIRGDEKEVKEFNDAIVNIGRSINIFAEHAVDEKENKLTEDAKKELAVYADTINAAMALRKTVSNGTEADKKLARGLDEKLREYITEMDVMATTEYDIKVKRLTEGAARANLIQLFLVIVALASGIVLGAWISRGILKSVKAVKEVADKAAEGDLSHEVPVTSNDEIGDMARSFNTMIENVRRVVEQINTATGTLASSSEELSSTSEELNKGSNALATQTEQVVTAMTEVSQTIMDMAKNASQAADGSKSASEAALKGKAVIGSTSQGMTSIATTVQGAATTIEELGKSSAQIGEIVSVINGIADQTNLLALNAAIEAARAGEQGRGFAVVADEVRKLAERTSQATRDIGQRITAIQQAAAESVDAMKKGSDEVDKGVGLAKEASGSLDSIVIASGNATDMVQRIAAATEEQSAATEQVSQNMEHISEITKRSVGSTTQITQSAEDLAKLAAELKQMTSWFKMNGSSTNRAAPAEYRKASYATPAVPTPASPHVAIAALSQESGSGKLIDWNKDLSVHIHEIDEQHKVLIGIINEMYDALKAARGKDAVNDILPRLVDYTVTHFAHEERLMEKHGYPGFLNHRKLHEALKEQVGGYANRLKEGRSTAGVEFMAFLKGWLTKHIIGDDMKYSPYLKRKGMA